MRSVEFHPEAQDEFISAAQFDEHQAEELGIEFILTVQYTYERLLELPAGVNNNTAWVSFWLLRDNHGNARRVEISHSPCDTPGMCGEQATNR